MCCYSIVGIILCEELLSGFPDKLEVDKTIATRINLSIALSPYPGMQIFPSFQRERKTRPQVASVLIEFNQMRLIVDFF